MKVMVEFDTGKIIWFHDVVSIVDYAKFYLVNTRKYTGKKLLKYNITTLEVIPDA